MRGYIYHVLAWDGMRRNRRLTAPYLITCICMVAVLYILDFLHMQAALGLLQCRGQNTISYILMLGQIVMLLFSLVFLFYTNSFLLRRRLREFGLYSVLGMGRKNLVRIISWESIITFVLALSGGLLAGIALSKMAELGLVNLLGGEVTYAIRLDTQAILRTLLSFSLIFALIWLFSVIRASRLSTVDLMKSESAGEKAPRGNLLLALLGAGLLVYAYDRAITIENPLEAIFGFFLAVIMVIIATYLLMISGSVRLCRVLQRWKNYYYKPQHFVSVSSMAFRMKRNGAGLASICIIATMVLVMLSSTTCLWFGAEDAMLAQYPREINLTVQMNAPSQLSDENLSLFQQAAKDFLETQGGSLHNEQSFRYVYMAGIWEGSELQCDFTRADDTPNFSGLWEIYLVSDTDYTEKTGEPLSLREDEAVLLMDKGIYDADTLTLRMGDISHTFSVKSVSSGTLMPAGAAMSLPSVTMVVGDIASAIEGFDGPDTQKMQISWRYGFDTGLIDDENIRFTRSLELDCLSHLSFKDVDDGGYRAFRVDARADGGADFFGDYAAFFFLGILLSAVFLLAAVLIIYYRQISEGYEDAGRFEICLKVGMTKADIRRSISSQLRLIFMLPLLFAGLHLCFAFPMIQKLLMLFSLYDVGLFARTTCVSFLIFAVLYALVCHLTSGVYYRIVSGERARE